MKILILCTGNSCRSQMAEAFLLYFDPEMEVFSAGTQPSQAVHPKTIEVMKEIDFDLSRNQPEAVDKYLNHDFDYVITVCDDAKETCPVFTGKTKNRLHIGFDDPAEATGTDTEITEEFRRVRDEIKETFQSFYLNELSC